MAPVGELYYSCIRVLLVLPMIHTSDHHRIPKRVIFERRWQNAFKYTITIAFQNVVLLVRGRFDALVCRFVGASAYTRL